MIIRSYWELLGVIACETCVCCAPLITILRSFVRLSSPPPSSWASVLHYLTQNHIILDCPFNQLRATIT
jgi:hypothetical protein